MTSRELDVLRLIEAGLTNAAISAQLFLSPRTIETHVTNLLAKSGAANRQALRAWYLGQSQGQARTLNSVAGTDLRRSDFSHSG